MIKGRHDGEASGRYLRVRYRPAIHRRCAREDDLTAVTAYAIDLYIRCRLGMTITARTPRRLAANATACPSLPDE